MTQYTHSRLEEAIVQLEALQERQKKNNDKYSYEWIEEILYDLRIVAEEIKSEK